MGTAERKGRERAERERRIIGAARMIAAAEGWNSVTVRRLADEIEYSQPVLYSHFANRDAIVTAVAVQGFQDLTRVLLQAAQRSTVRQEALGQVAWSYLAFARKNPALYEAMFVMPNGLKFAKADTRSELNDAFAALAAVVGPSQGDVEAATETFWASLHGLAELERSGRIRQDARDERMALLVSGLFRP